MIRFFNIYHNGDVHMSREFVKDIMNKTKIESIYHHANSSKIIEDLNIVHDMSVEQFDNDQLIYMRNNDYHINTWFHSNFGYKYYGCSLEALYFNFKQIYDVLKIDLEEIEYYIPKIDYNMFNISQIDDYFNNHLFEKYIFISNGDVKSNQSDKLNLSEYILKISNRFKNCLFILTEKLNCEHIKNDNVIFSSQIIGSNGLDDLVENSYLSTKCDILVGRNSGPSTFAVVIENVLTDKKQDIIHMSQTCPLLKQSYYNENKKLHLVPNSTHMVESISDILKK